MRAIYPDGYGALGESWVNEYHGSVGLKYKDETIGLIDLSGTYGRFDQTLGTNIGINAALGVNSPIGLRTGGYASEMHDFALRWSRSFDFGVLAAPLNVAAGVWYRDEHYQILSGQPESYATGGLILDGPNKGKLAPSAGGSRLRTLSEPIAVQVGSG